MRIHWRFPRIHICSPCIFLHAIWILHGRKRARDTSSARWKCWINVPFRMHINVGTVLWFSWLQLCRNKRRRIINNDGKIGAVKYNGWHSSRPSEREKEKNAVAYASWIRCSIWANKWKLFTQRNFGVACFCYGSVRLLSLYLAFTSNFIYIL